jgi:uncharacterized protein YkwD
LTAFSRIAACIGMACILLVSAAEGQAQASPSPMVDKINDVRRAHGLHALRYSSSLSRSSGRYARHLARTNRFQHAPRIRASHHFRRLGEILARMPGPTARRAETIDSWLASPGHRAVLLGPSFKYVGGGRALSGRGADAAVVWTIQFGR